MTFTKKYTYIYVYEYLPGEKDRTISNKIASIATPTALGGCAF